MNVPILCVERNGERNGKELTLGSHHDADCVTCLEVHLFPVRILLPIVVDNDILYYLRVIVTIVIDSPGSRNWDGKFS